MNQEETIFERDPDLHVDPVPRLPNFQRDLQLAKRYLQQYGQENETTWNQLIELIHRILVSKREVTPRELYNLLRRLREKKVQIDDWIRDIYIDKSYLSRSLELIDLYTKPNYKWDWEERTADPDTLVDHKFFPKMRMQKNAGLCIPDKEIFAILMAMRVLAENIEATRISFWGKIFGILRDYYIVECEVDPQELDRLDAEEQARLGEEFRKEEQERIEKEKLEKEVQEKLEQEDMLRREKEKREKKREKRREKERKRQLKIQKMERQKQKRIAMAKLMGKTLSEAGEFLGEILGERRGEEKKEEIKEEDEEEEAEEEEEEVRKVSLFDSYQFPKLPVTKEKIKVEVPSEPYGQGINKRYYYVCHLPGESWTRLPDVTPKQIYVSRKIKRFFIGDLEADIISTPAFPGKEKNYLRAMIARISAGAQVSPSGYYFGAGGEEEAFGEEEGMGGEAQLNAEFKGVSWAKLLHPSQSFWVHHTPYILPQGRLTWWEPPRDPDINIGEGGEGYEMKPERGPPILRTINRDLSNDVKPWTLQANTIVSNRAVSITARSNIWYGAHSTVLEFNYQFLYVGWGVKFSEYGYSPPFLPPPKQEYEIGPEIQEMLDPTPEEEEAYRLAQLPKVPKPMLGEGGEGGEVDEEEEEDV